MLGAPTPARRTKAIDIQPGSKPVSMLASIIFAQKIVSVHALKPASNGTAAIENYAFQHSGPGVSFYKSTQRSSARVGQIEFHTR
jgi:hypothetical protein